MGGLCTNDQRVVLDPADERERVHAKYARMRRRDLVAWGTGLVVILATSRFVTVDW